MNKLFRLWGGIFLFSASIAAAADPAWLPVSWDTADRVHLIGQYHAPARKDAVTWVLLHGLGSGKSEWFPFVDKVVAQGQGVLVYDARGHGESTLQDKQGIYYQNFHTGGPGSEWNHMVQDLDSAVRWAKKQPGVGMARVAVGGASLGANVALVYASQHPEVPALMLLSPGLEYAGIQTPEAYQHYGARPLFLAASPKDAYAYATVQYFARQRGDPALRFHAGQNEEHGVHMLHGSFESDLLAWMKGIE